MSYKRLFVWVEGPDDLRFFETVAKPILTKQYDCIDFVQYGCMKDGKMRDFIASINAMNGDYIFAHDMDEAPCVSEAKEDAIGHIENLDAAKIVIVRREIESWYLAGLNLKSAKRLGFRHPGGTEGITKEEFNDLLPRRFRSRVDFMIEVLKSAAVADARRHNGSFDYFARKYLS